MKAVILAAGMGTRLRPLTEKRPKAFLEIDGIPLIRRSIENLLEIGIKEFIIVVGYMKDYFRRKISNYFRDLNIIYVPNQEYSITGSMYSLSVIDGIVDDDILLLESDLLYEKVALKALINSTEPNEILVAPLSGSGDEVYICVNENNELINLGKNIDKKDIAIGELVGISKLSLDFMLKLFECAKEDYAKNEKNYHYEEVIFKLSKTYPIKCRLINDLSWIEIDNENDLKRAIEIIYPKIKIKERING